MRRTIARARRPSHPTLAEGIRGNGMTEGRIRLRIAQFAPGCIKSDLGI